MKYLQGMAGSPGCEVGIAAVFVPEVTQISQQSIQDVQKEIHCLDTSRRQYMKLLAQIGKQAYREAGKSGANIFEAYQQILLDRVFFDKVKKRIQEEKLNAAFVLSEARLQVVNQILKADNAYLRERAADINNSCQALVEIMQSQEPDLSFATWLGDRLIVVAEDMDPAHIIQMDRSRVKGFVTQQGGITSHAVLLAKSLGLTVVVGVSSLLEVAKNGDSIYVNGNTGEVVLQPDESFLKSVEVLN